MVKWPVFCVILPNLVVSGAHCIKAITIDNLRHAVPLQTFTIRHSNRKLSVVMALSTTFTHCVPGTTKFGKISQNKGHFAVQGHSRSPILVPIESSYTTSY